MIMRKFRIALCIISILVTLLLSLKYLQGPKIDRDAIVGFNAQNTLHDLKVISMYPHSFEHPNERRMVRNYLYKRLNDFGLKPVIYNYDSIKTRLGTYSNASNIYAVIDPVQGEASSYILLVAHYDSRFSKKVNDKIVYSKGAADDGYGIATILELIRVSMSYHNHWNQGIKILFTDMEENELDGMKAAWKHNREIFDKTGLVINLEARGVKGAALMFETSPNNLKIIDIYKEARHSFSYSITSFVYSILPNFTDFSVIKDEIPGMNFSVVDNLHYYHTDKDNFNNISVKSIQHYGVQTEPILKAFLTDSKYSNVDYFKAEKSMVFHTIPYLGLLQMTKDNNLKYSVLFGILFLVALYAFKVQSRIKFLKILLYFWLILLFIILGGGTAHLAVMGISYLTGIKATLVSMLYVPYEFVIMLTFLALISLLFYKFFIAITKKRGKYFVLDFLSASLFVYAVLAGVMFYFTGENLLLLIPFSLAVVAFLLNLLRFTRILYLVASLLILASSGTFIYLIAITLTIGSLSIITSLVLLTMSLVYPLLNLYCRKIAL